MTDGRHEGMTSVLPDVLVVLVPADAGTGAERLGDPRFGAQHAQSDDEQNADLAASAGARAQLF
jgi:hypothetical protein